MTSKIAISVGDPASVASISVLLLLESLSLQTDQSKNYSIHIFADKNWLYEVSKCYFSKNSQSIIFDCLLTQFHHIPLNSKVVLGLRNLTNASYVIDCLNEATDFVLSNSNCALLTGPVDKSIIQSVYPKFIGHTEFLAKKLNQTALMNFTIQSFHQNKNRSSSYDNNLHIALASDHTSLINSINILNNKSFLEKKILLFNHELKNKFGIQSPKIGIIGLNPHAGENGSLGREEIELINPVINKLKELGLNLIGALPADSALLAAKKNKLNGLMSLYHDQVLPAIKHSFFDSSINVTLGLNLIRTSVDHGVAFDIANNIKMINPLPLKNAFNLAIKMIKIRNKNLK